MLGSDAKLDKCGVCGGKGQSCKFVTGSFEKASYGSDAVWPILLSSIVNYSLVAAGYNDVITFPAGTTAVQVNQPPILARDDNYLGGLELGLRAFWL